MDYVISFLTVGVGPLIFLFGVFHYHVSLLCFIAFSWNC